MKAIGVWAGVALGVLVAIGAGAGTAGAAPEDGATELKDFACGTKEKPCPLQGWMKTVMAAASGGGDGAKLSAALDTVSKKPPPGGYDNWAKIAKDGSDKAKKGDIDGAKESCKACHDAYKDKYKDEIRDRPWP
ncbi:MAG TPA: hypothetical protein VGM56_17070 [Byssovorax sp.]|jgi:hypothetical protein